MLLLFIVLSSLLYVEGIEVISTWSYTLGELYKGLLHYCQNTNSDKIILLDRDVFRFKNGELGDYYMNLGNDITECQRLRKQLLLGIPNEVAGDVDAESLLLEFGPVNDQNNVARPLGNAVVDGFQLMFPQGILQNDFEDSDMIELANSLSSQAPKTILGASFSCDSSVEILGYLKATVQLPVVDFSQSKYECSIDKSFGWEKWSSHAQEIDFKRRLLVGILGSVNTDYSYIPDSIQEVAPKLKKDSRFGGFALGVGGFTKANAELISHIEELLFLRSCTSTACHMFSIPPDLSKAGLSLFLLEMFSKLDVLINLHGRSNEYISGLAKTKLSAWTEDQSIDRTGMSPSAFLDLMIRQLTAWARYNVFQFQFYKRDEGWEDQDEFKVDKFDVELSERRLADFAGLSYTELKKLTDMEFYQLQRIIMPSLKKLLSDQFSRLRDAKFTRVRPKSFYFKVTVPSEEE